MDLYKGKRFWPTLTKEASFSKKKGTHKVDVLVIGGGMSGLLSAYSLARAGKKVFLVEKDSIANGSSSLNTGLIQYMSDVVMVDIDEEKNKKVSNDFYLRSQKALDYIEEIVNELDDPTISFRRNNSLYVSNDEEKILKIKREVARQNELNFETEFLDQQRLKKEYGIDALGGLLSKNDVELNPMAFVSAMATSATQNFDLLISEQTKVNENNFSFDENKLVVDDLRVQYDKLVIATGYDVFPSFSKYLPKIDLVTSFVVVTEPINNQKVTDTMFWESSSSYLYFRKSPDNRLIIGGEDEENITLSENKAKINSEKLIKQVQSYQTNSIKLKSEYFYEAIFGESSDGLPYIGPHPENHDIFIIHGVGGNGTVYSAMGAIEIVDFSKGKFDEKMSYLWPSETNN